MVEWQIVYTKQAVKDAKKIQSSGLKIKVQNLVEILSKNPYQTPPQYEKLTGDLKGAYSRRINLQHRLIYQIITEHKIVKIIRMWTHYE